MKSIHFNYNDLDTLRLINQSGVQQFVYPASKFNASWDSILVEGKVYFSLCTELTTSMYTKFVMYDIENNYVEDIFDSKNFIQINERTIRDSKLHTGLSVDNDGKILMITHTTDKAPKHPAWMPEANYSNPWEGYPGSSFLTYDPKTKNVENHGILVARESLYGGKYDRVNNYYYAIGYNKGHLYRYDLDTRITKDLGKVTERASYRFIEDLDLNLYFSTRNGRLRKINTKDNVLELLDYSLPNATKKGMNYAYLTAGTVDDKGLMYLSGMHHNEISIYNPKDNTFKQIGPYTTFDSLVEGYKTTYYIGGMFFDNEGILWYVIAGARLDNNEDYITPLSLMRWDLTKPRPEYIGIVGTLDRVSVRSCELHFDKKLNTLIIVGTNHANDGIEITTINLNKFNYKSKGPVALDPLVYPNNNVYKKYGQSIVDHWNIVANNPYYYKNEIVPYPIWQSIGTEHKIDKLVVIDNDLIVQINESTYKFDNGELYPRDLVPDYQKLPNLNVKGLGYYNGRQYRSEISNYLVLKDNIILSVTKDGFFSLIDKNKVFNMGTLGVFSPVIDMVKISETKVIGIMGDKDDMNFMFEFTLDHGLKNLGIIHIDGPKTGCHRSTSLGSIVYDKEKNVCYVSSNDEMPTIYELKIGELE